MLPVVSRVTNAVIPPLYGHSASAITHQGAEFVAVFGGLNADTTQFTNELTHLYVDSDSGDIAKVEDAEVLTAAAVNAPSARHFHSAVVIPALTSDLLFDCLLVGINGIDESKRQNRDRENASGADVLIVFAGKSNGYHNDLFAFDYGSASWYGPIQYASDVNVPLPRYGHSAVVVPVKDSSNSIIEDYVMYVFGGYTKEGTASNELYSFSIKTRTWSLVPLANESIPPARYCHSASVVNERSMYIFGGYPALNDLWRFDIDTNEWQQLFAAEGTAPTARYGHSSTAITARSASTEQPMTSAAASEAERSLLYIIGGCDTKASITEESGGIQWIYDISRNVWIQENNNRILSPTENHAAAMLHNNNMLLVIGGKSKSLAETTNTTTSTASTTIVSITASTSTATTTTTTTTTTTISQLPDEIVLYILRYLPYYSLYPLAQTSKTWPMARLSNNDEFWEARFRSVVENAQLSLPHAFRMYAWINQIKDRTAVMTKQLTELKKRYNGVKRDYKRNLAAFRKEHRQNINDCNAATDKLLEDQREKYQYVGASKLLSTAKKSNFKSYFSLPQTLKVVFVGDGAVGKTCFLISYTTGQFPSEYIPTVFDNYVSRTVMHGQGVDIGLWDTAGPEEYDRLRPLSYPHTDVFALCFSLISQASFENVPRKWIPELCLTAPGVPIVLVGTKLDLLHDERTRKRMESDGRRIVQHDEAEQLAKHHGLSAYVANSALTGEGVSQTMEVLVLAAGYQRKPKDKKCTLQ